MPRGMKLTQEAKDELLRSCHEVAESNGGRCLASAYINATTKLPWECAEGHRWDATPNNVRHATWCPQCYSERRGKSAPGSQGASPSNKGPR